MDGDAKLTQSSAIIRHIARQNDSSLIPNGPEIEMIQNFIMDVWFELSSLIYGYTVSEKMYPIFFPDTITHIHFEIIKLLGRTC